MNAKVEDGWLAEPGRAYSPNPEGMQVVGPSDREWSLILASALAWAVGRFEGIGVETGYAGEVLDRWRNPQYIVKSRDES